MLGVKLNGGHGITRQGREVALPHGHCQALFTHFAERNEHKICEHAALCATTCV
jgi:hypothetical protein